MADEAAKEKLLILAAEIKHEKLTLLESYTIKKAFDESKGTPEERAVKSIAEALELTEGQVLIKLAASDNGDRVLNDIVDLVKPTK